MNFITGAGGFLQSVIAGYGGTRLEGKRGLRISPPRPPGNATSLTLRNLHYAGWRLRVESVADGFFFWAMSRGHGAKDLIATLSNGEKPMDVTSGTRVYVQRPSAITISVRGSWWQPELGPVDPE